MPRRSPLLWICLLLLSPSVHASVGTYARPSGLSTNAGGLAIDDEGNVYSADFGGSTVIKITPEGAISVFLENLKTPTGNVFDAKGAFYQSNYRDQDNPSAPDFITKVSANGRVSTFATGLSGPAGLTVGARNTLFVAMCDTHNVFRIKQGSEPEVFANSPLFNCPNSIVFGERKILYVANFSDGAVLKITPNGTVTRLATIPGGGNGHLSYVAGDLYVTGRLAHQVFKVNAATGAVTLFAGTGVPGNADGSNLSAQFNSPNAITRNPEGSSLFTNGRNNVVRRIDLDLRRPKKPKKPTAKALSPARLRIRWKHRSLNREGFSIELAVEGAPFEEVARVRGDASKAVLRNLISGGSYLVRVRAFNGTGSSRPSRTLRVQMP